MFFKENTLGISSRSEHFMVFHFKQILYDSLGNWVKSEDHTPEYAGLRSMQILLMEPTRKSLPDGFLNKINWRRRPCKFHTTFAKEKSDGLHFLSKTGRKNVTDTVCHVKLIEDEDHTSFFLQFCRRKHSMDPIWDSLPHSILIWLAHGDTGSVYAQYLDVIDRIESL